MFTSGLNAAVSALRAPPPPPPSPQPARPSAGGGDHAATVKADAAPNEQELRDAAATVRNNFDTIVDGRTGLEARFGNPDQLRRGDLERVANDPNADPELRDAAHTILYSPATLNFLDVGAGKGDIDGRISREDLDGAIETIDSGNYADELLDTAAGIGGRDGKISDADLHAALNDPGVPQDVKDTIRLLRSGAKPGDDVGAVLGSLSGEQIRDAAALANSAAYKSLSRSDQALVADAILARRGNAGAIDEARQLLEDPAFRRFDAEQRTARLTEFALVNSAEFRNLPPADQQRIRNALETDRARGVFAEVLGGEHDAVASPAAIRSLIESEGFQALDADERTAVLSQVQNYPDARAVTNFERLAAKEWFQDDDLGDKQRALKLVGHMSTSDGDRAILDNTLDKFLAEDAPFRLEIAHIGAGRAGEAGDGVLTIQESLVAADNDPLAAQAQYLADSVIPHEVSHLIHDDHVAPTFEYLNAEYRAWYVGFTAQNGRAPTNEEALGRWAGELSVGGVYWDLAAEDALADPAEAAQIFELLSDLTGLDVDEINFRDVLRELADGTRDWGTNAGDPAAVVPPGNLDNH